MWQRLGQRLYTRFFSLLILLLFYTGSISPATAASDSSSIKIQITIDKSMLPRKCSVGFEMNNQHLSSTAGNNCNLDRNLLLEQANQLTRREASQSNQLKIVTVTITAP